MARTQAPVTAQTMINRINRAFASKEMMFIKNRQDDAPKVHCQHTTHRLAEIIIARQDAAREHGAYCLANTLGEVIKENLNLEDFGRAECLLKPHEYVVDFEPDKDAVLAKLEKLLLGTERRIKKVERLKKQYTSQGLHIPEWLARF